MPGTLSAIVSRIDPAACQVLGARSEGTGLVQAVEKSSGMESAVREMVRRRPTERQTIASIASRTVARNKAALIWEGEPAAPGKSAKNARSPTNNCIAKSACSRMCSNATDIKKGDRIIIYLPMVPEAAIAMLACTRIGAVHSVVFGGFSAQSVADRIFDCQAKMVITADGGFRRGAVVPLKKNVDDALR